MPGEVAGRAHLPRHDPAAHRYTVRFHTHRGKRYGVCNCKAGSNDMFCYHLIPAAIADTAVQHMRAS